MMNQNRINAVSLSVVSNAAAWQRKSYLAHGIAKRPRTESHSNHEERYSDEEKFIGYGQIEDVPIGDGLHFSVAQHDVNDERIA